MAGRCHGWRELLISLLSRVGWPVPSTPRPADVQIPLEVILGPVGALGIALVWIWDLRKQRDDAVARLNRIIDKFEASLDKAPR